MISNGQEDKKKNGLPRVGRRKDGQEEIWSEARRSERKGYEEEEERMSYDRWGRSVLFIWMKKRD